MCSTITDFLEDKIANTKKNSNTSNLLQGSLKEVNNLCGKGIIPQVSEIQGLKI